MSQPVRLSDEIMADARLASDVLDRSIAGQIEHWARLGQTLERHLNLAQIMALKKSGKTRSLKQLLEAVGSQEGQQRLQQHLQNLPYPHYSPDPESPGIFIRTLASGQQSRGKFVKRQFVEL
ncbi:MAG: hypothetical protein U0931_39415 [Vulcanimicrobiota bacterium]